MQDDFKHTLYEMNLERVLRIARLGRACRTARRVCCLTTFRRVYRVCCLTILAGARSKHESQRQKSSGRATLVRTYSVYSGSPPRASLRGVCAV